MNSAIDIATLAVLLLDCVFLITFLEDTKSNHRENRNNSKNLLEKEADNED